jgi:NAD(P)-dependent dehydrogenase (short-subunit alcohol dehydrogenase family)
LLRAETRSLAFANERQHPVRRRKTVSLEKANTQKTIIVTGASQGIGAGLVKTFLDRGYKVVANSRNITRSGAFEATDRLALVDGNIAESATAVRIAELAKDRFGSIDALVNNAGIYFSKQFTDYTVDDLRTLVSVNIEGFLLISQLAIRQMLAQKVGGSIVNISSTLVDHPIAGANSSVPMITKGGLEAVTRSLAMEYVRQGIRVNAVAPGIVDTPMHKDDPKDVLRTLQPMGQISSVKDIVDAIVYLTEAGQVTGEVLHVDGGAHVGKW